MCRRQLFFLPEMVIPLLMIVWIVAVSSPSILQAIIHASLIVVFANEPFAIAEAMARSFSVG